MALRIRRGTNSERLGVSPTPGITFALGEIVWVTDTKKVYVGDGATVGGKNILETSVGTGLQFDNTTDELKINESYVTDLAKTTTSNLFSAGTHVGITFDYGTDSISATVDYTEAQAETIRQEVVSMFDSTIDDIVFAYDTNAGKLLSTLREERVRYYSRDLFLGGNHTGISFFYQEDFNILSATVDTDWIKDTVGNNMFPAVPGSTVVFDYNTDDRTITASVQGVLTALSDDLSPMLGANLDLNNYAIVGNGSIEINGPLRLNPLTAEPFSNTGSIATANQADWDPVQGVSPFDQSYLVWNNGTNWVPLSDYQQTNVFFVDSLRSHEYIQTGTINSPFKTIAAAIFKATVSGYNQSNPAFIVLMNNITEDVTLTRGGIYLSGVTASDSSSCVKLFGSITIDNSQDSVENTQFSISNLYISAPTNYVAVSSIGLNLQKCILKNVKIDGEYGDHLIHQSNDNDNSELIISDSEIISNHTYTVNIEKGNASIDRCFIKNTNSNSNGIRISSTSTVSVTDTIMNILSDTGLAIKGEYTSIFKYHNIRFVNDSNNKLSSIINTVIQYTTEFTPSSFYNIQPDISQVGPNGTVQFNITTENIAPGTTLYWNIDGATALDFADQIIEGSVDLDLDGFASVTRIIASDVSVNKQFVMTLRSESNTGLILANSSFVSIIV